MALESLLKHANIEPDHAIIIIDANVLYLFRPEEIDRFTCKTTAGAKREMETWRRFMDRYDVKSRYLNALSKMSDELFFAQIYQKDQNPETSEITRYELSRRSLAVIENNKRLLKDVDPDNAIRAVGGLNAKHLTAASATYYKSVLETTDREDWREGQMGIVSQHAIIQYEEKLKLLGIEIGKEYYFTYQERCKNIRRHIKYLFNDFLVAPERIRRRIRTYHDENLVDQMILMSACTIRSPIVVIISADIDLREMYTDLASYRPEKVEHVKIITPTAKYEKEH